ncbi:MAG: hypothetical protein V7676_09970 [Parasphingorhabdus sp.]|uniref:hypothetical protein n=1 Tax=Parasphingorhabdus sp. TaxID=2709688 RepID=UPI003001B746
MTKQPTNNVSGSGDKDIGHHEYKLPADIVTDPDLDKVSKRKMLVSWKTDIDNRLIAEGEGMSASNPISAKKEASLADQERLVNEALEMLDKQ